VLFWESETVYDEEPPTVNRVCGRAGLPGSRTGIIDPENRCSFPVDRATPPPENRSCCKPAKLQGQSPCKSVRWIKHSIISVFFVSVDTIFTDQKTHSSVCQTERFTGLFEIQSCLHPHHLFRCPSCQHLAKRYTAAGPRLHPPITDRLGPGTLDRENHVMCSGNAGIQNVVQHQPSKR
jgi:hypothetical protein